MTVDLAKTRYFSKYLVGQTYMYFEHRNMFGKG